MNCSRKDVSTQGIMRFWFTKFLIALFFLSVLLIATQSTSYAWPPVATSISFETEYAWGPSTAWGEKWYKFTISSSWEIGIDLVVPYVSGAENRYDLELYNSDANDPWLDGSYESYGYDENITKTLTSGTYYIKVYTPQAITDGTNNMSRLTVSFAPLNSPPTTPGTISSSNVTFTSAKVSWGASSDPDGDSITYEVEYKKDFSTWTVGTLGSYTTTSTYKDLSNLESDTTYDVRVRAYDGKEYSNWRDQENVIVTPLLQHDPVAFRKSPSNPVDVVVGVSQTFEVGATDENGDLKGGEWQYKIGNGDWQDAGDWDLMYGNSDSASHSHLFTSVDIWYIKAIVYDQRDALDTYTWTVNVEADTGNLKVYSKNENGTTVSGKTLQLYDNSSPWNPIGSAVTTNSSGYYEWNNLDTGTYNVELYDSNDDFWGNGSKTVSAGTTATLSVQRVFPWLKTLSHSPSPKTVGQNVHIDVTGNGAGISRNAKVELWIDRDKSSLWDYHEEHGPVTISSSSAGDFGWDYTPPAAGTYYVKSVVKTNPNGTYIATDTHGWDWSFEVSELLGDITVKVKDQSGNYKSGIEVLRYQGSAYIDTKTTTLSGATWSDIPAGVFYRFDAYKLTDLGYGEYWGSSGDISTDQGGLISYTINRVMPYANMVRIQDEQGNPKTEFAIGEKVKIVVDVVNDTSEPKDVKVQCQADRDKIGGPDFDFDDVSVYKFCPGQACSSFEFTFSPPDAGDYYVRPRQTFTQTIGDQLTDSWDWPENASFIVTPNNPPSAPVADISNQPIAMYPGVQYSITAKYYDADGADDLHYCYLRLQHPDGLNLTMMWDENTKTFSPWAGEDGANYLTLDDVQVTLIDGSPEGYEITWTFALDFDWSEAESGIRFGVYAEDDGGLISGWNYPASSSSFKASRKLDVPYYNQDGANWCWASSASMILRFYGYNRKTWQIAADFNKSKTIPWWSWDKDGATASEIHEYFEDWYDAGSLDAWDIKYYGDSQKDTLILTIKTLLSQGHPIFLGRLGGIDWPPDVGGGHAVVITGYDDAGLYIHDPSGAMIGKNRDPVHTKLSFDEFKDAINDPGWQPLGDVAIIYANSLFLQENKGGMIHGEASINILPGDIEFYNSYGLPEGDERMLAIEWDGLDPLPGYKFLTNDDIWHSDSNPTKADTLMIMPHVTNHTIPTVSLYLRAKITITSTDGSVDNRTFFSSQKYLAGHDDDNTISDQEQLYVKYDGLRSLPPGNYILHVDLEGNKDGSKYYNVYDACEFQFELLDSQYAGVEAELLTASSIEIHRDPKENMNFVSLTEH